MAAKLQCEICGGKLIGRPGGIFECDSCGMEYDTSWAKQKIQEITGTVKVEGTVDVQGTVKVDSSANKEALLKRGMMALEEEKWNEAKGFFDQALNYDAEYAEAYLGLAMVEGKCKDKNSFTQLLLNPYSELYNSVYISRATKYATGTISTYLLTLEKQRIANTLAAHKKNKDLFNSLFSFRDQPARNMICECWGDIYGLKTDGTILICHSDFGGIPGEKLNKMLQASRWHDIVSIEVGRFHILGLCADGTVIAAGDNSFGQCNVTSWSEIVAIKAVHDRSYGIKADGTVVAAGNNSNGECEVGGWTNITELYTTDYAVLGLKDDGTIEISGQENDYHNHNAFNEIRNWKNIKRIIIIKIHIDFVVVGIMDNGLYHYAYLGGASRDYIEKHYIIPDNPLVGFEDGICLYADRTATDSGTVLWKDVVELDYVGVCCGIHSDGTVSLNDKYGRYDDVSNWHDVIKVIGDTLGLYALCKDGTILTTDKEKKDEISRWKLFDNYENIDTERKESIERAGIERKNKIDILINERTSLQNELSNLTGLFSGKRRKEIQRRILEIESKLDKLK